MNRRALLGSLGFGLTTTLAGCVAGAFGDSTSASDEARDAPTFNADEDGPGEYILLTAQPQAPNGIVLHDEFEIAIALGNTGGEPLSGEVTVEIIPSTDDVASQTASVTIGKDEKIPSGAARFFRTGPYKATSVGNWELTAGPEIAQVHPEYDGTFEVKERSDN
jgi:hypothetical protein